MWIGSRHGCGPKLLFSNCTIRMWMPYYFLNLVPISSGVIWLHIFSFTSIFWAWCYSYFAYLQYPPPQIVKKYAFHQIHRKSISLAFLIILIFMNLYLTRLVFRTTVKKIILLHERCSKNIKSVLIFIIIIHMGMTWFLETNH